MTRIGVLLFSSLWVELKNYINYLEMDELKKKSPKLEILLGVPLPAWHRGFAIFIFRIIYCESRSVFVRNGFMAINKWPVSIWAHRKAERIPPLSIYASSYTEIYKLSDLCGFDWDISSESLSRVLRCVVWFYIACGELIPSQYCNSFCWFNL